MNVRKKGLWLTATLALFVFVTQPSEAPAITLDTDRGVLSLAPTLEPIMPAVVQILVEHGAPRDAGKGPQDPWRRDTPASPGSHDADPSLRPDGAPPEGPRRNRSSGSGVIIDSDRGLILTNHHVVVGGESIKVKLTDGREADAEVVGSDEATDVALLRIDLDNLTAMPVGNSEDLRVGDLVVAIGYPFGIDQTVTLGIVSGLGRKGIGKDYEDFIQTDAAINSGNSGGALVDSLGRLAGINTAIYSRSGGNVGIGFAVPARMAMAVVEQLLAFGEVRRGRLGVEVQDLTAELAKALGISRRQGALITRIQEGSPSAAAGLRSGDIVIRAGDQAIDDSADLRNVIGLSRPDSEVVLVVLRDEQEEKVTVKLQVVTAATAAGSPKLAGASFGEMAADNPIARYVEGVVVGEVDVDSLAARQGLRKGDVVTHVNRKPVADLSALGVVLGELGPVTALTVVRGNSEFIVILKDA